MEFDGFMSMGEVCAFFCVTRTTIGRWEAELGFPRRVHFGRVEESTDRLGRKKRCNSHVKFRRSAVLEWAQRRIDESLSSLKEDEDESSDES
jgi:predicted DNA-binding transcriptional regulator AlpA